MQTTSKTLLPAIIDVEASGFGKGSYPIEIGIIFPDGKTYCTLIKPAPEWTTWDKEAEKVHFVPRAMLFEKGKDIKAVAQRLNDLLIGKTVYTDAWGQDFAWIAALYEAAGMTMNFRLQALVGLLSESQKLMWHETRSRVQKMLGTQRHRASADAKVLQMTYHWSQSSAVCHTAHSAFEAV
jgi:hypothetical protein